MIEDSGSPDGVVDDRSMWTKIADMEERMDGQDPDIRALRADLAARLDVLIGRIRQIDSGAVDVDSARTLSDYLLEVEGERSTLRERYETAIGDGAEDRRS
jgi:hypothetical protein